MAGLDDVVNLNLGGGGVLDLVSGLFLVFIIVFIFLIIGIGLFFIIRLFRYNIEIELFENKAGNLEYFGMDKAKRQSKKGVSYIKFLKSKDDRFKSMIFPPSEFVYKKKLFGSKIKFIIDGDDVYADRIKYSEGAGLTANPMPPYMREDYLNRLEDIERSYGKSDNKALLITLGLGITFGVIMIFGLIVIWQSNVATAEATRALASAITSYNVNSVPTAPG